MDIDSLVKYVKKNTCELPVKIISIRGRQAQLYFDYAIF